MLLWILIHVFFYRLGMSNSQWTASLVTRSAQSQLHYRLAEGMDNHVSPPICMLLHQQLLFTFQRQASSGGCNAPKVYTLFLKAHPPLLEHPVRLTSRSCSDKDTILLWFPSTWNGANSQALQTDLLSKQKITIVSYMRWWGCSHKSAFEAWLVTSWLVSSSKRLSSGDHQQDISGLQSFSIIFPLFKCMLVHYNPKSQQRQYPSVLC